MIILYIKNFLTLHCFMIGKTLFCTLSRMRIEKIPRPNCIVETRKKKRL